MPFMKPRAARLELAGGERFLTSYAVDQGKLRSTCVDVLREADRSVPFGLAASED